MGNPMPAEIRDEIHEVVKQFFHRHRNEFKVYGDALTWTQNAEYEDMRQEAGMILRRSLFMNDILYLISSFGPNAEIDFASLTLKIKKAKPDFMPPEPEPEPEEKKSKKRGRPARKRKKGGPTNALGNMVEPVDEEHTVVDTKPTWTPKRVNRRAGRVPPGALAEAE